MDDFFALEEWDWTSVAAVNYGALGIGSAYKSDDELDEILRDYMELTGSGSSQDVQEDEENYDNPKKKLRKTRDPLGDGQSDSDGEEMEIPPTETVELIPKDEKLIAVAGLGSLVEELSNELEILVFYYRKCYMKNLSNSNYIRQSAAGYSISEVATSLNRKFITPYISGHAEFGGLAVPSSDCGQKLIPFWHQSTTEWTPCDLNKLKMCVFNAYYHRKLFLIDSRFHQMMFTMGFTSDDLHKIHSVKLELDKELWNVMKIERLAEINKADKYLLTVHKFIQMELKFIEEIVVQHVRDKMPIIPLALCEAKGPVHSTLAIIELKDLIDWKQNEAKLLYRKRMNLEGKIEVQDVDWLMVEKDMFFMTGRTESADDLKKIYQFYLGCEYNHRHMSRIELSQLKALINIDSQRNLDGIDWTDIASQLGTKRTPIRIFQTYRDFMCNTESNSIMNNYNNRLAAFLHIKKYVGHLPRIVDRLTNKLGPVNFLSFGVTWQEINPRFAIGEFLLSEDAALLVAMELHQEELNAGKTFSVLQYRLPWRHSNVWRRRAVYLFRNFDKWTIEEDRLLLYSIRRYGLEWSGLPKLFPKRPKNTIITRYHLLRKKLAGITLAQYHSIYYRRISKSSFILLSQIANVLRQVLGQPQAPDISGNIEDDDDAADDEDNDFRCGNEREQTSITWTSVKTELGPIRLESSWQPMSIPVSTGSLISDPTTTISSPVQIDIGNSRQNLEFLDDILFADSETLTELQSPEIINCDWKTPNYENVFNYLKTFDRKIIMQALNRLKRYISSQNSGARSSTLNNSNSNCLTLNCDRRKFFPSDPVSVASALHLRRVELKPLSIEMWENLTEFEKSICHAYTSFTGGWKTKKSSARPTIPSALSLSFLPCIRNVIKTPRELACDPLMSEASPAPPQKSIEREKCEIFDPEMGNYTDTTICSDKVTSDVQIVLPTVTLVEAQNSLHRRVWNNCNESKVKRMNYKNRRKALNAAAAKARWDKAAEKSSVTTNADKIKPKPQKKQRVRKRIPWYNTLIKFCSTKHAGGFDDLELDDVREDEELDETSGENTLLTVLHDHSYMQGYVPWVKNVVSKITATGDEDSAKENDCATSYNYCSGQNERL